MSTCSLYLWAFLWLSALTANALERPSAENIAREETAQATQSSVVIIPINEAIDKANLFILRRALKQAISDQVDCVILDMDTPGGRLDVTLEMMEMLARFEGETGTYVNVDAISAGSFIAAATKSIYFAPTGKMGASAVIQSGGAEVPETAAMKIESYLRANLRAITEDIPYRADVLRAMLDADFEFKIGDAVIKPAGELLTLTAKEAMQRYGEPPQALLASGIYESMDALLDARFGVDGYTVRYYEITYSESLAKWMNTFAPALMGIGLLFLFLEFKTPGFGLFGGLGIACIAIFFASQYIAGLAGNEVILFFILGVLLVLLELFFFPGTLIAALSGLALIFGSLLWAMIDLWPNEGFDFKADLLFEPALNLMLALLLAVLGALLLGRFFQGSVFERLLVLDRVVGPVDSAPVSELKVSATLVGQLGHAVTDLYPSGRIELAGQRYDARSDLGPIAHGAKVRVVGKSDFGLIVVEETAK